MTSAILSLLCASMVTFCSFTSEEPVTDSMKPAVSNVSEEPSPFNFKHFLRVVKKWDALESMLNADGFIKKLEDDEGGYTWVKNCNVKVNNGKCYPQNPSQSSVIIDYSDYRGNYFFITVWGQDNANRLINQLNEIGYKTKKNGDNSYSFDEPSNEDTQISVEQHYFKEYGSNSYTFMLYVIAEDY